MKNKVLLIFTLASLLINRPLIVIAEEIVDPIEETSIATEEIPATESSETTSDTPENNTDVIEQTSEEQISDLSDTDGTQTTQPQEGIEPALAQTIHLILRYQDQFIFNENIALPTSAQITFHGSNDSNLLTTNITGSSVLAALIEADNASENFSISDISYYSSFNSYLLNCIAISNPISVTPCYNWNYVVDGGYPTIGMDQNFLHGGETVYIYFSNPWQISATPSVFTLGTVTIFHTEKFQYDNLITPWASDPNDQISISIPNPNPTSWWDTSVVVTSTISNANGEANFVFDTTGTYYAQITAPDFSKYSSQITITVTEPIIIEEPNTDTNNSSGSSGSTATTHNNLDIQNAINFLNTNQNSDGSFDNTINTDWAAIAYGAYSLETNGKNLIKQYLLTDPDPGLLTTDFERRAMALEALGISPYNGTKTNYIEKIINSYQNNQFGDINLFNDDIFAIFPLIKAGISPNDPKIAHAAEFIINAQNQNGSWGSIDITAAAIQALKLVPNASQVSESLSRARRYLVEQQSSDGGFGHDLFSTAWAAGAINALGESPNNWTNNNQTYTDYFYSIQQADGGVTTNPNELNARIWGTSYAIPAAMGKTWYNILNSFPEQNIAVTMSNDNVINNNTTVLVTPTTTLINNLTTTTTQFIEPEINSPATTQISSSTQLVSQEAPKLIAGVKISIEKNLKKNKIFKKPNNPTIQQVATSSYQTKQTEIMPTDKIQSTKKTNSIIRTFIDQAWQFFKKLL